MAIGMLLGVPIGGAIEALIGMILKRKKVGKEMPPEEEPNLRSESWASILKAGDFTGGIA